MVVERAKRDSRRGSQRARGEKRRQDAGVLVVVVVIAAWGTAEILRFAQDDKQLRMVRGVRMGSVESVRGTQEGIAGGGQGSVEDFDPYVFSRFINPVQFTHDHTSTESHSTFICALPLPCL